MKSPLFTLLLVGVMSTTSTLSLSAQDRLHFSGYGEVHYNNPKTGTMDEDETTELDFHRFVLGWGYEFTETIRFESEVDFEHAGKEIELEYAYLEYDLTSEVSLRGGSLLMPVGPLNEFHEPPLFYSVERPYNQRSIIPTTWQEIGAGVSGRVMEGKLAFRVYGVSGLDGMKFTTLDGIREGRSKGSKAKASDLALVGRVEYSPISELQIGGSGYFGGADQGDTTIGDVTVNIVELDARVQVSGFELHGVFTRIGVEGAETLSAVIGEIIGDVMEGWYVEIAYDIFQEIINNSEKRLILFVRREKFDTLKECDYCTFIAVINNRPWDREVTTVGAAYYPIHRVAIKTDYEFWKDGTGEELQRFNLGLAFMF